MATVMSEDVNLLKTVELVFRKPSTTHDILPTELPDVQRVSSAKLLGVVIRQHLESIITTCNQRLYLLAQLRRQNFSVTATDNIGMRAAYSFKHPLFSDYVEFCGCVCMYMYVCFHVRTVFQNASSPAFLVRLS